MVISSHQGCSIKKGVPESFAKFTGKHLCQSLFSNEVTGLRSEKDTLAKVFSCEFPEIFNNTFFIEHLRTTASVWSPNMDSRKTQRHIQFRLI